MARASHTVKVRIEAEDAASGAFDSAQKSAKGFSDFLSRTFVVTAGDVFRTVSAAFESLQEAVTLKAQEKALEAQLKNAGQNLDDFIGKLKEVSDNTISTADAISASSRALLLGIPATEISSLLEGARVAAAATGVEVSTAFNDITTGIARASPLILDNLGFVINLTEVYEDAAKELGKTAEEMTKTEQSAALLNLVLEQSRERAAEFGDALQGIPTTLAQLKAEAADTQREVGNLLLQFAQGTTQGDQFGTTIGQTSELVAELGETAFNTGLLLSVMAERGLQAFQNPLGVLKAYRDALKETEGDAEELAETTNMVTEATENEAAALQIAKAAFDDLQSSQASAIHSSDEYLSALDRLGVSLESNVNTQIGLNNSLLAESAVRLAQGAITAGDFARIELAVADANRDLTASLSETNTVLSESQGHYESAATGLGFYRDEAISSIGVFNNLTTAINAASSAAQTGMGSRTGSGTVSQQADLGAQIAAGLTAYGGVVRGSLGGTVTNASLSAASAGIYQGGVDLRYARSWAVRAFSDPNVRVPGLVGSPSWNEFIRIVESGQHAFYEPGTQF